MIAAANGSLLDVPPRRDRPAPRGVRASAAAAVALHVLALAGIFLARPATPEARAPVYRVDLVAAPPGPRAAGIVAPRPARGESQRAAPPALPVPPRSSAAMPMPNAPRRPPTPAATPTLPRAEPLPARADPPTAARAGGGDVGDRGADVATVRTEGIEFPYPGYLENIVRQIALRFDPPKNAGGVRAEIKFLIRRDGSATIVQFVTRSGVFAFDQEAQAAIEAAANARAFGPLPDRFADDALPVIFSFDPRTIR